MAGSVDDSNSPFQKGNPLKNKNYNKLLWQYSLATLVLVIIGLLFVYLHSRHT